MKRTKTIAKYVISAILLVVSVYYTIEGINFDRLLDVLTELDYLWVILPIPIIVASHVMRAVRWRTLLSPFHKASSLINLFSATIIGYLFNNVSPRGGELVRPFVFSKREKISYSSTFGTIIVERFLDLITLSFLIAFVFFVNRDKIANAFPADSDPVKLAYISLAIILVMILALYPPSVKFFLTKLVKPLSENLFIKLTDIFNKFRKGFAIIKSPSRYLQISFESLVIWFLYALPLYMLFFAFGFQESYNLGIEDALLLVIVSGIGVTIAPTPGAIGVYHYLVKTALMQLYGMDGETALAYATVAHAIAKLMEMLLGGIFILRENIKKFPTEIELEEKVADV